MTTKVFFSFFFFSNNPKADADLISVHVTYGVKEPIMLISLVFDFLNNNNTFQKVSQR